MFPRSLFDTVRRRRPRHPAQRVAAAFAVGILVGTILLLLPYARAGPGGAPLHVATFTATSAVCVSGLIVVDTATYWSTLGQVIIMLLVQVGGLGFMVLASLLALAMSRRLGLRQRLLAQTEINVVELGETRRVLLGVAAFSVAFEVLTAAVLTGRLWLGYGEPFGRAAWYGLFHSVSAFNNAGFALYSDNLVGFVDDGWVSLTVTLAVIAGGLGFPVLIELIREPASPGRWSLHTKLTLTTTGVLLAAGTLAILAFEWSNPATFGRLDLPGKLLAGFFHGASPRSSGFNTVDYGEMGETSWLVTEVLMFIGAGSAGTTGGLPAPHPPGGPAPGPHRHPDRPGRGGRGHPGHHRPERAPAVADHVRGVLGLRVGRDDDRDHAPAPSVVPEHRDPADVPWADRPDYTGDRARPARARAALPLPGGTTDHWLATYRTTGSWWSAWAASGPRWPPP
jgi:Cation transport protein